MRPAMRRIASTAPVVEDCTAEICAGDLLGRLGGLHRERLHLRGDHREALAGFAGARRLDGGVEGKQVGLPGDVLDELDHVADLLRRLGEAGDLVVGGLRFGDRDAHELGRLVELAGDLGDRAQQLLGGGRRGLDVAGGLV